MPNVAAQIDNSSASAIGAVTPTSITAWPEFGLKLLFRLSKGSATIEVLGDGNVIRTVTLPNAQDSSGVLQEEVSCFGTYTSWGWRITAISGGGTVYCLAKPMDPEERVTVRAMKAAGLLTPTGAGAMTSFFVGGAALVPDWVSAPWSVAAAASFATGASTDLGQQLVAWRDTTVYTYTSNPMLPDHEGTMQASLTGELLHYGMRRIYNELRYTEKLDFTGTMGWYQPNGLTVAPVYHAAKRPPWWVRNQSRRGGTVWKLTPGGVVNSVQRWPDSSTAGVVFDAAPRVFGVHLIADTPHQAELRVYPAAGGAALASVIVNVTTDDQLFALPFTPDGVTAYNLGIAPVTFAGTGTTPIYMHSPMICRQTLNTQAAPSEYMPRDYVARINAQLRDGGGVDGVGYFGTTNGNTLGANGLVTEAAGTKLTNPRGLATGSTYSQFLCTDMTTWSRLNMAAPTTGIIGPDGKPSAYEVLETTSDGVSLEAHHIYSSLIQSNVYGGKWVVPSVCAKRRSSTDRRWVRIVIADLDSGATTGSAWFDMETGAKGQTSGTLIYGIKAEPLRNGWWRFFARYALKSGVGSPTNAVMRIYSVTGDGATTHVGDPTKGLLLAFPNATAAIQNVTPTSAPVGNDRALPCPYVPMASTTQAITVPGQAAYILLRNSIGQKNIAVSGVCVPYFDADAPYKGGTSGNLYSATAYVRCEALPDTVTGYTDVDLCRFGLTIRPNYQNTTHYSKWAFDLYTGWPSQFYWQPNTYYAAGKIVMPRDTLMDNKNTRRWLTCVVPGTSGSSEPVGFTSPTPTWVATPDTTTSVIDDNGVKWQCNVNNGILGNVEGYLGAHLVPPNPAMLGSIRYMFWVGDGTYGCTIDGVPCVKQTQEQLDQGMTTELPAPPKVLHLGQMGTSDLTATGAGAMGVHWMFHRDIVVRHSLPVASVLAELSA